MWTRITPEQCEKLAMWTRITPEQCEKLAMWTRITLEQCEKLVMWTRITLEQCEKLVMWTRITLDNNPNNIQSHSVSQSDLYVTLSMPTASIHTMRTKSIPNCNSPEWNETFHFRVNSHVKLIKRDDLCISLFFDISTLTLNKKETKVFITDEKGAGGNWATVGRRSRGGRRVHRQREKRKGKSVGLRIGTLNVGTMTGKGRELTDMMERRKVDILCVQETRWKGSKARSIGAGFKLFYYGVDSKRNGVGVVLKEEFVRNVLEVKRVSDRVMSLKLEIEGVMLNVSGYAPQVGCELEEKERFWSELDEVMESIPTGERVVIGADFNGHVGEGNTGDEEVMGKFGVKERNLEGQMVVDFAKRMDMAVVNTYFQKREEHRVTYKSGGRRT
ncbi:hypothetical protein QTP70_009974 [Hemibagrus guttatus]|uniref:C2 domain-containing protein n=1 Tax=Hemibagrus guttatus TaxID=175788 RepID=A0AAE0R0P1_9TELE|nr:hypothetical protein QTP70_009974 [Hemibagrus guttatus]